MKSIIFLIISAFLSCFAFSQESQTQTLIKVKTLQEKKIEFHKRTGGETDGYRVKIHFSAERTKADEARSRFNNKHSDIVTYIDYQQPNWVIMVGDYKTKLEAYESLKRIKEDFPYAFIVKSKVRPMKLN